MENTRKRKRAPRATEAQRYLTVGALAARWRLSLASAYRMIEQKALPSIRFGADGGAIRIPFDAVEQFEKKQLGRVPSAIADDVA